MYLYDQPLLFIFDTSYIQWYILQHRHNAHREPNRFRKNHLKIMKCNSASHSVTGSRGRDHMVVGFITTCAISFHHHQSCVFRIPLRWGVLNAKLCDKVCQWLAVGQWFFPGTMVSFINKTDCHVWCITEILLKVTLNTITIWWNFSSMYYYIFNLISVLVHAILWFVVIASFLVLILKLIIRYRGDLYEILPGRWRSCPWQDRRQTK
jgi:hypothetical protein